MIGTELLGELVFANTNGTVYDTGNLPNQWLELCPVESIWDAAVPTPTSWLDISPVAATTKPCGG